ncbi:GNAT family N-acetyltransferase [Cellulosimicrobium terreum]|nr:GNAT family N-acetyltransferase [Cellulosimicrobium terreum]
MLLRPALPSDAARCALVHHTVWRATYTGLITDSFWEKDTLAAREAAWMRWLGPDVPPGRGDIVVAEVDDEIVGFAIGGPATAVHEIAPVRDVQLHALNVLPEHHGSGVGQALLDAVVPAGPAQLWVVEGNARARRFYARNGFEPDGTRYVDEHVGGMVEIRAVR